MSSLIKPITAYIDGDEISIRRKVGGLQNSESIETVFQKVSTHHIWWPYFSQKIITQNVCLRLNG